MISEKDCNRLLESLQWFRQLFTIISPNHCNHFFNNLDFYVRKSVFYNKTFIKTAFCFQEGKNIHSFLKWHYGMRWYKILTLIQSNRKIVAMVYTCRNQKPEIAATLYFLNFTRLPTVWIFRDSHWNIAFSDGLDLQNDSFDIL